MGFFDLKKENRHISTGNRSYMGVDSGTDPPLFGVPPQNTPPGGGSKMTLFGGILSRGYLWQLHTVLTLFFYEMFKICIENWTTFTLPFCDWIFKKLHRNALFLRVLNEICVQKVCKNRAKIATCDENDSDSLGLSLTQHVFFAKWMVLMSKITKICTKFTEKWYPPSRR